RARAGAEVHIAVLGKSDGGRSEHAALAMILALRASGDLSVQGLRVKTSQLGFTSVDALAAQLDRRGVDVLYICPGFDAELPALLELTRRRHLLSIAGREDYVARGASFGVFTVDGSPTMF